MTEFDFTEIHCHTDQGSNLRFKDSTVKVEAGIDYAIQIGLKGVAITDHESLSAHIRALNHVKKLKAKAEEKGEVFDFSLLLGNEIYLIDQTEQRDDFKGQPGTDNFWHFLLLAKDAQGHRQLRELSTRAWQRAYSYKGVVRPNTFYQDIEEIVGKEPGHLIASTACLGGRLAHLVAAGNTQGVIDFCAWCRKQFGEENFFIEVQCGVTPEQIDFNQRILRFCKTFGYPWVISNDVHYLSKDKRKLHEAFLNSSAEDEAASREMGEFYESTYFKTPEEMMERLSYYEKSDIVAGFRNSERIRQMCADAGDYGLFRKTIVPERKMLHPPVVRGTFAPYYNVCPNIKALADSPYEQDRFFLQECEKGMAEKNICLTEAIARRVDVEVEQMLKISDALGCRMSGYYNLMQRIIEIAWTVSFVGNGRGSSCGFYCAYLMNITQVDSIKHNLPWWRHIHQTKVELADVDSDFSPSKRPQIFELLKQEFGYDRCLNIITFRSETLKSAIKTACRGLGIDSDTANELSPLVPVTRGHVWTWSECCKGTEDNGFQPVTELLNRIRLFPMLEETIQEIEGLVSGSGIHASGFYIFNNPYLEQVSMMRAPNGTPVTCWEMADSDAAGCLKVDLLVTDAVEKMQKCVELLCADGLMQWQGSLKATYDKYLHPDVLNYDNADMWDEAGEGKIIDLFQFQGPLGIEAMRKIRPRTLKQLALASSVMRLMGNEDMEPMDHYVALKGHRENWIKEMQDHGLNDEEQQALISLLDENDGCSIEQEDMMRLVLDPHISGFTMPECNKLRKGTSKKKKDIIDAALKRYYEKGQQIGTRKAMLDYVYTFGIKPQLG